MKRILAILFLLIVSLPGLAQNQFKDYQNKAEKWFADVTVKDELPKGAKLKTVDIPNYHYCITGFFSKNNLTEGQIVSFYNTITEPRLILEGKVSYVANRLLVRGIKYDYSEKGICRTYGSFYVSNSPEDLMVYKPKKAQDLSIADAGVKYYIGYYFACPTIVVVDDAPYIVVDGETGGRSYSEFSAPLSLPNVARIGYNNLTELLLTTGKGSTLISDGIVFKGTVQPRKTEDESIVFRFLTGEKTGFKEGPKSIKVYEQGQSLLMEREDDPANKTLLKEVIVVYDKSLLDTYSYWDVISFIKNMDEIRRYWRDGDSYIGQATYSETILDDGNMSTISTSLTTGVYTFSNGDSFEGDLSKEHFYGVPISGITHFKDGTSMEGNWLEEYELTDAQYSSLSKQRFPSVIRESAKIYWNNNRYDRFINAAKEAERTNRFEDAKYYYTAAKEIKPNQEDWDALFKELDSKIAFENRRKGLVGKYGVTIGNKLAEGVVEIGMTKQMVIDAMSDDDVLLHSFRVSKHTDRLYNQFETWEYDFSMAKKYMESQMEGGTLVMNLMMGLGSAIGYNFRAEVSNKVKYKYLKFKNNKLIELKDTSTYDDIDDAVDEFNNYLRWAL